MKKRGRDRSRRGVTRLRYVSKSNKSASDHAPIRNEERELKVAIVDYSMGNIRSLQNALKKIAVDSYLSNDRKKILSADHVILPGVGSAEPAMKRLWQYGLTDTYGAIHAWSPDDWDLLRYAANGHCSTECEGEAVSCLI